MERYPKIKMQYEKLLMAVNQASRKETDPIREDYLTWLRIQLEAIDMDHSGEA